MYITLVLQQGGYYVTDRSWLGIRPQTKAKTHPRDQQTLRHFYPITHTTNQLCNWFKVQSMGGEVRCRCEGNIGERRVNLTICKYKTLQKCLHFDVENTKRCSQKLHTHILLSLNPSEIDKAKVAAEHSFLPGSGMAKYYWCGTFVTSLPRSTQEHIVSGHSLSTSVWNGQSLSGFLKIVCQPPYNRSFNQSFKQSSYRHIS